MFIQVIIFKVQSTSMREASLHPSIHPNIYHSLRRNQSLPPHTDYQFPVQVPPIRRIPNSSSMHIPEPSPLMLILKTWCDFSVREEEVFCPGFAIERWRWGGAVMEDVETGLLEVGWDVVDPSSDSETLALLLAI